MNVHSRKGYQSLSGAAFRDYGRTTFRRPLLRNPHRGNSLGQERLSKQSCQPRRQGVLRVVERWMTLDDPVAKLGTEHAQMCRDVSYVVHLCNTSGDQNSVADARC
jgi:hypothetical protein